MIKHVGDISMFHQRFVSVKSVQHVGEVTVLEQEKSKVVKVAVQKIRRR